MDIIPGGTVIPGETAAGFNIPTTLTAAGSPYYYYCVVSSPAAADAASNVARVNVNAPATYTVTFVSNGGTAVSPITGVSNGATITAPTPPAKTGYDCKFAGWYGDIGLTSIFVFTTAITGNTTLYAKWEAYSLGDTGPGGGFIFFVADGVGFLADGSTPKPYGFTFYETAADVTGITSNYLEAAPNDISGYQQWAAANFLIPGLSDYALSDESDFAIGRGMKNTAIIIADAAYNSYTAAAASECVAPYDAGGSKTDWFLPSKDELAELYKLYEAKGWGTYGNLTTNWYWSSSQNSTANAWYQSFTSGSQTNVIKVFTYSVRAVRAF